MRLFESRKINRLAENSVNTIKSKHPEVATLPALLLVKFKDGGVIEITTTIPISSEIEDKIGKDVLNKPSDARWTLYYSKQVIPAEFQTDAGVETETIEIDFAQRVCKNFPHYSKHPRYVPYVLKGLNDEHDNSLIQNLKQNKFTVWGRNKYIRVFKNIIELENFVKKY